MAKKTSTGTLDTPSDTSAPTIEPALAEEAVLDAFLSYLSVLETVGEAVVAERVQLDAYGAPMPLLHHPRTGEPLRLQDVLALSPQQVYSLLHGGAVLGIRLEPDPEAVAAFVAEKRAQALRLREAWGAHRRAQSVATD